MSAVLVAKAPTVSVVPKLWEHTGTTPERSGLNQIRNTRTMVFAAWDHERQDVPPMVYTTTTVDGFSHSAFFSPTEAIAYADMLVQAAGLAQAHQELLDAARDAAAAIVTAQG